MSSKTLSSCFFVSVVAVLLSSTTGKTLLRHLTSHGRHHLPLDDNEIQVNFSPKEEQEALVHSISVTEGGTCDKPKLQVVHVSDHYSTPQKFYLPHCTLLYRCGKHAGCCGTDRLRCVAAVKETVTLSFYTVQVLGEGLPTIQKIEKLAFTNHTKCACELQEDFRSDL